MGCVTVAAGVIVCSASDRFLRKRILRCPTDQCRTEMVVRSEAWHGDTLMCCRCGDSWQDGELAWRPFRRGWRKERIAYHRELWHRASHGKAPTMEELYPDLEGEV